MSLGFTQKCVQVVSALCCLLLFAPSARSQSTPVVLQSATSPTTGQGGVTSVYVTGSGFPSGTVTPTNVLGQFDPVTSGAGPSESVQASAATLVVGTSWRITFRVPANITPSAPTSYKIGISGTTSTGKKFASSNTSLLTVNPPASLGSLTPNSSAPGNALTVSITGIFTTFVQGTTTANFGSGVSVGGAAPGTAGPVTVTGLTTATAKLSVDPAAAGGPRDVLLVTGSQQAVALGGFHIIVNHPPIANSQQISLNQGTSVPVTLTGSDPDGDPTTFAVLTNPTHGSLSGTLPTLIYTPSANYFGSDSFLFQITDSHGASGQGTISIAVVHVNHPPVANSQQVSLNQDTSVPVTLTGSDPDGDPTTFAVLMNPTHGSLSGTSPTLIYTPNPNYFGPDSFVFQITDNHGASGQGTISITVAHVNHPPVANAGSDQTVAVGTNVVLNGRGSSDPDNDNLSYSWSLTSLPPGSNTSLVSPTSANPTFVPDKPGKYVATLVVNDGVLNSLAASTNITVLALPIASAGPAQSVAVGSSVQLDGSGSSDPAGRSLSYLWSLTGEPNGSAAVLSNPSASNPTFDADKPGSYLVQLVVNDGLANSLPATVSITTLNRPPVANLGGPYSGNLGNGISFNGTASSDPDGDPLTYSWDFGDGTTALGPNPTHAYQQVGRFTVTLEVTDGRGGKNDASTTATITTFAPAGQGSGFLRGAVFNDKQSLPLEGAQITLLSDGSGTLASGTPIQSDAAGQFAAYGIEGTGILRVEKDGFISVERQGTIVRDTARALLDARLTPFDTSAQTVTSLFGGTAQNSTKDTTLNISPGALAQDTTFRVTAISSQGLQGQLPLGWSPIAGADISPYSVTLSEPALLTLTNAPGVDSTRQLTSARYDLQTHAWISGGTVSVSPDGQTIQLTLSASGQWVVLAPDADPFTPPLPQSGQPLQGTNGASFPANVTVTSQVAPPVAAPGDSAKAVGTVLIQTTQPMPSGTPITGNVSEQYTLNDTSVVVPSPFSENLLVYTNPKDGTTTALGTSFAISPSRNYTLQQLAIGHVTVDVTPAGPTTSGAKIGTSGGVVSDTSGNTISIASGALSQTALVDILGISVDSSTSGLPSGYQVVGAVGITVLGGTLNQTAALSIPRPTGLADSAQVIIAQRFVDNTNNRRFRIVAIGIVQSQQIVSQSSVVGTSLSGITSGGQYLFITPASPLGFITGTIFAVGGAAPEPGVLVTADSTPFADISSSNGTYLVAGQVGTPATLTAIDGAGNVAMGASTVASQGNLNSLNLTLGVVAPSVVSTTPANGATGVPLDASIQILFSKPIAPASVTSASVILNQGGTAVSGDLSVSVDGRAVTFTPSVPLSSNSVYTLALTSTIVDLSGNALTTFSPVSFTSLDTSKPAQPPAGQITALLPDQDGLVMIVGTQGSAQPGTAVTATNLTTQITFTALAQGDGSFRIRIAATLNDTIGLTFRNGNGQNSNITITQFQNADGTTAFGSSGGTVPGPGGLVGSVLPRALTQPGIFKLDTIADTSVLPALSSELNYLSSFQLSVNQAVFNSLSSLTLSESQGRFTPQVATRFPFQSTGSLAVPSDFLITGTLKFSALAQDTAGNRNNADGSTLVVGANPAPDVTQTQFATSFPNVYLSAPSQALLNQQITAQAIAPTARMDFQLSSSSAVSNGTSLLLVKLVQLNEAAALSVRDQLVVQNGNGNPVLVTSGRNFPGAVTAGDYAVVSSTTPLSFITGHITGSPMMVSVDNSPFVAEVTEPNGAFIIPVFSDRPFTLNFYDAVTGANTGTYNGTTPGTGSVDIGAPLSSNAPGTLHVSADPSSTSVVDIGQPLVFSFSEAVDVRTLSATSIVVTDPAGSHVFGNLSLSDDKTRVTFTPLRRWRFGTTYSYGVSTSVLALSGAQLDRLFTGQFTTFAPRLLGKSAVDTVRDIAVNGNVAVVAGSMGLNVLDVTQPISPALFKAIPLDGGAGGVTLASLASFIDKNGNPVTGTLAFATTGNPNTNGTLQILNLNDPTNPTVLGSAQLTVAPGQNPPANVPNIAGTPHTVSLLPNQTAFVAVPEVGTESVNLSQAIPPSSSTPGAALGPRYPAQSFEGINDVAVLKDKLVAVGVNGLTVLDASTLAKIGGISTTGNAQAVAVLPNFTMDVNGDGKIDPNTEVFDLAVVANGQDGTLQYYNLSDPANPLLISAIRFSGPTTSVVLSATENLAYVGNGNNGVAIVDMTGPASVQPLDQDLNQLDDRILGTVNISGPAGRIALDLGRGVGYVANDIDGYAVVQLIPPNTSFVDVIRDPLFAASGDEQSILQSRQAFTSDDGLQVNLNAIVPPQTSVLMTIDEIPQGGPALLTFTNGATSIALSNGANAIKIINTKPSGTTSSAVQLTVRTATGAAIASFDLGFIAADTTTRALTSVFVAPSSLVITAAQSSGNLSVGGRYSDGVVLNLTAPGTGTTYLGSSPAVITVDSAGKVTATAGGTSVVLATNQQKSATAVIRVDHPAVLTGLEVTQPYVTLISQGAQQPLQVFGTYSDQSRQDITRDPNTQYTTSDPSVVTVDSSGVLTAIGQGVATVTVINSALLTSVHVASDFRIPPNVAGISLTPFTSPVTASSGETLGRSAISGTGSLEGLVVTFTVSGGGSFVGITDYSGAAVARITGLTTAGTQTITSTITNPADGTVLSDSKSVTVLPASGDNEPNDDFANPSRLDLNTAIQGTVGGGTDPRDVYAVQLFNDGTLTVHLIVTAGLLDNVQVVVKSDNGVELARNTPTANDSSFDVQVPAGTVFVSVEDSGSQIAYTLATVFTPTPITITSVSPTSGPPGTAVTISGTGFSLQEGGNVVLFGGIVSKIVSATTTQIVAEVPANAANGSVRVISGGTDFIGPTYESGLATPPSATVPGLDPATLRFDPVTGTTVVVNRLVIQWDPSIMPQDVLNAITPLGGIITGNYPALNTYVVDFSNVHDLAALSAVDQRVALLPGVTGTLNDRLVTPQSRKYDTRELGYWPGTIERESQAFDDIRLFDALEFIRNSPQFRYPMNLAEVRVAVIDTGLVSTDLDTDTVELIDASCPTQQDALSTATTNCTFQRVTPIPSSDNSVGFLRNHGTSVTSIISAVNNGTGANGILAGLFQAGQKISNIYTSVYGLMDEPTAKEVTETRIWGALHDLVIKSVPYHVANLSFGAAYARVQPGGDPTEDCSKVPTVCYDLSALEADKTFYAAMFSLSPKTLFILSAGNIANDAFWSSPAGVTVTGCPRPRLKNGLFSWAYQIDDTPCGNVMTVGSTNTGDVTRAAFSNFGLAVNIAAPGTNIPTTTSISTPGLCDRWDATYRSVCSFNGTSASAPIVTGVAALLQAISPGGYTPEDLKNILTTSATDITPYWTEFGNRRQAPLGRVNALAAVKQVLGIPDGGRVYVIDGPGDSQCTPAPDCRSSHVVALRVDSLTGTRGDPSAGTVQNDEVTTLDGSTLGVNFGDLSAVAVNPATAQVYVLISEVKNASNISLGSGIAVLSPNDLSVLDFMLLSGGDPQAGTSAVQPSPVVIQTNHPRMAFSPDGRLLYVATGDRIVLINAEDNIAVDQPDDLPDLFTPDQQDWFDLGTRLATLSSTLIANNRQIEDLQLSSDGKILYVLTMDPALITPAQVIAVDIDVYKNKASAPEFYSDLSTYLTLKQGSVMQMSSTAFSTKSQDTPKKLTISADGKYLYIAHGGGTFTGISPDTSQLTGLIDQAIFELGYVGPIAGIPGVIANQVNRINQITAQLTAVLNGGTILVNAPGIMGVFQTDKTGTPIPPQDSFMSALRFGSTRPPVFATETVYAKRPSGMAVHPSGRRALVSFFQSGNFGILDLDQQVSFSQQPDISARFLRNPQLTDLSHAFQGYVGVTTSIPLDPFVWPINPEDVPLLFPTDVLYAQNGRFAAAIHTGSSGHSICAPPGNPSNPACFQHGAISIISDDAITAGLATNPPGQLLPYGPNANTSYYSLYPVCALHDTDARVCTNDVVTRIREADTSAGPKLFTRPSGMAIQPIVTIEDPRFGDYVASTSTVQVNWIDPRVTSIQVILTPAGTGQPYSRDLIPLSSDDQAKKSTSVKLFEAKTNPAMGLYKLQIAVLTGSNASTNNAAPGRCTGHPANAQDTKTELSCAEMTITVDQ